MKVNMVFAPEPEKPVKMVKPKQKYVIKVDNKGYLHHAAHAQSYGHNLAYNVRYTDDLQTARVFASKSAASNCKVIKMDGAKAVKVKLVEVED